MEIGTAGASARARYETLRRRNDERLRRSFGFLTPLARLVAGPDPSTEAWARGAEGEEAIGAYFRHAVGDRGIILHDRSIPRRRANLDHIAVVPSGVWVIDSKHYRGRLERRRLGRFRRRAALYVADRDRTALIVGALRQRAVVAAVTGTRVPVRAALCFTGTRRRPLARPFMVDGVLVTWPRTLATLLTAPGPFGGAAVHALAVRLASAFPPCDPA